MVSGIINGVLGAVNIRIDGSSGGGVILKPQSKIEKIMDEEESPGI